MAYLKSVVEIPQFDIPEAEPIPANVPRVVINTAAPVADEMPTQDSVGQRIMNRLFGLNGVERYQTWPEKLVRDAVTAPHDVLNSKEPLTSQDLIKPAFDISAMAGTGGLAGGAEGAVLNATPSLRPALKFKEKIYKAPPGGQHLDALSPEMYSEFQKLAMSGEDINHYNFGFMNHKGQFLSREKALDYAIEHGLLNPNSEAARAGTLTSTMDLMADSSKPAAAVKLAEQNAQPFYSVVENAVKNAGQAKASAEQWLGYLKNQPGVRAEELEHLGFDRLKGSISKAELEKHIAENQVQLGEVWKGTGELKKAAEDLQAAVGNEKISVANHRDKLYADEIEQGLWSGDIAVKDLPTNLQSHAEKMLSLRYQQENPTKYQSYQLPGGENYRELLLTLPDRTKIGREEFANNVEKYGMKKALELRNNSPVAGEQYKSSHWDEPNVLAHIRMNDRTINGKKTLHVEEIQSDWHQQGRRVGYSEPVDLEQFKARREQFNQLENELMVAKNEVNQHQKRVLNKLGVDSYSQILANPEAKAKFKELQSNDTAYQAAIKKVDKLKEQQNDINPAMEEANLLAEQRKKVPNAPFKKNWDQLALKKVIRHAAENGYDQISWTPGEAQAARYDLSKSLKELQYLKNDDGTYQIAGVKKDGSGFNHSDEKITAAKLPDVVGKEMAEKIIKNEGKRSRGQPSNGGYFEGVDLKVGGEGMKGFYDKMLVDRANALGKKFGAKVETLKSEAPKFAVYQRVNKISEDFPSAIAARMWAQEQGLVGKATIRESEPGRPHAVHVMQITPGLRQQALTKGFPLFSAPHPGFKFLEDDKK